MNDRIIVHRPPQPFPCIIKEMPTWEETMKTCSDFEIVKKGLRCQHWDVFDGCKLKRVFGEAFSRRQKGSVLGGGEP